MNSSTSISDRRWPRLLGWYAICTLQFGMLLVGAVVALDPYDTGRFALFDSVGVPQFGQRLAAASLGRAPQWNTAIIGNSTIQLVDPAHLTAKNTHAVSLAIPGTGPREQFVVARWFLDHHPDTVHAFIIGLDDRWCAANHPLEITHPFPFWLYSNAFDYLVNMMQVQSLESAARKIKLMRGKTQALRVDGYNDYDTGRNWDRAGFLTRHDAPTEEGQTMPTATAPYDFPAAPLLTEFLATLPPNVSVVFVMPPQYKPDMKSDAGKQQKACADSFAKIAAGRPQDHFVDFLTRSDLVNNDKDYWDRLHYRARIARLMEVEVNNLLKNRK